MKMIALVLALMLAGTVFAQTTLGGYVWGGKNWHKVYIDDNGLLPVKRSDGIVVMSYGTFRPMHDGSPGYITIMKGELGFMARTLAHELCHARQEDRKIQFTEVGCG